MDSGPVSTFQVHEHLRPKVNLSPKTCLSNSNCLKVVIELMWVTNNYLQLCDLYENDSIFDKFECCLSGDGQRVATGSYRSITLFSVIVITASFTVSIELKCLKNLTKTSLLVFARSFCDLSNALTLYLISIFTISAIYSEFSDPFQAVLKQPLWKLAKTPWGIYFSCIWILTSRRPKYFHFSQYVCYLVSHAWYF